MMHKAILAGYCRDGQEDFNIEVIETVVQKGIGPLHSSYFRSGKLEELKDRKVELNADIVVINDELNASQIMTMEEILDCGVLDRTSLILNIFHDRARTKQARLQVEIARLQYALPRLLGSYSDLGRQGGVGGARNKGLGEKKIALDKRRIERQIQNLKKELKEIEKHHKTQSESRNQNEIKKVALVGYTNAGKSTLMNVLLKNSDAKNKQVFEKDMLFATLDTSVRLIDLPGRPAFLLSDTVGFIDHLPPILLEAFKTTLSEVKDADLLLHVINLSSEEKHKHEKSTEIILQEIEAKDIPAIKVYTHLDRVDNDEIPAGAVSSITEEGIKELIDDIIIKLYGRMEVKEFFIPYCDGNVMNKIMQETQVLEKEEKEEGIRLLTRGCSSILMNYRNWIKD